MHFGRTAASVSPNRKDALPLRTRLVALVPRAAQPCYPRQVPAPPQFAEPCPHAGAAEDRAPDRSARARSGRPAPPAPVASAPPRLDTAAEAPQKPAAGPFTS